MTVLQKNANGYVSIYPVDPMPAAIAALRAGAEPVWVFAYGSLMWNPEIAFAEARPGFLHGYHRSFCLYSRDYRGTPERPGLVLGLDRGGSCRGIVYRLPPDRVGETLDRIWAREMTGQVYRMRRVAVRTPQGEVAAHACVVRRDIAGLCRPPVAGRGRRRCWPTRSADAARAAIISPTRCAISKSSAFAMDRCIGSPRGSSPVLTPCCRRQRGVNHSLAALDGPAPSMPRSRRRKRGGERQRLRR